MTPAGPRGRRGLSFGVAMLFKWFKSIVEGNQPAQFGADRDPRWRYVRRRHLERQPRCLACGSHLDLEVHHIADYSTYPSLELDPNNLMTLCGLEANGCHFEVGHNRNWRKINPAALFDALTRRLR